VFFNSRYDFKYARDKTNTKLKLIAADILNRYPGQPFNNTSGRINSA
jgi:hypothetical protein